MESDKDTGLPPLSLAGPIQRIERKDEEPAGDDRWLEAVADSLMESSKRGDKRGVVAALKALRELE